jgi:hypothetical protein
MTPVTRRIADAEKNGFIFLFGPPERFFSPGIPVHGIVSMLQKVRAGFMDQAIPGPAILFHSYLSSNRTL